MAAVILLGDVYEVKFASQCAGQAGINVTHWVCNTVTGGGALDTTFASVLDTAMAPLYKLVMGANATYYGVRVQRISPLPKSLPVVAAGFTGIGGAGPGCLPTQVSGIITWQSAVAGRKYRGRSYVPFPYSGAQDTVLDAPTAAYKAALQNLANGMAGPYTPATGGGTSFMLACIWHRLSATVTPITNGRANQKFATQRRRGNYGAANAYPPF